MQMVSEPVVKRTWLSAVFGTLAEEINCTGDRQAPPFSVLLVKNFLQAFRTEARSYSAAPKLLGLHFSSVEY